VASHYLELSYSSFDAATIPPSVLNRHFNLIDKKKKPCWASRALKDSGLKFS